MELTLADFEKQISEMTKLHNRLGDAMIAAGIPNDEVCQRLQPMHDEITELIILTAMAFFPAAKEPIN